MKTVADLSWDYKALLKEIKEGTRKKEIILWFMSWDFYFGK